MERVLGTPQHVGLGLGSPCKAQTFANFQTVEVAVEFANCHLLCAASIRWIREQEQCLTACPSIYTVLVTVVPVCLVP